MYHLTGTESEEYFILSSSEFYTVFFLYEKINIHIDVDCYCDIHMFIYKIVFISRLCFKYHSTIKMNGCTWYISFFFPKFLKQCYHLI